MTLPPLIEPKKLAQEQKVLQGELPLAEFTRSKGLFTTPEAEKLWFSWGFSLNQHNQLFAVLQLKANLKLKCQSCHQEFAYPLGAKINMQGVRTEQEAEALPLEVQPLYVDEAGRCNAFEVIEDELILNIPDFPRHEKNDCSFNQNKAYYDTPSNGEVTDTYKPFANLKLLTKNKSSKEKK